MTCRAQGGPDSAAERVSDSARPPRRGGAPRDCRAGWRIAGSAFSAGTGAGRPGGPDVPRPRSCRGRRTCSAPRIARRALPPVRTARHRPQLRAEPRERQVTRVARGVAEPLLDPQQLVVLRDPLGAGRRTGLDLPAAGRDREVGDRGVLGLPGAVAHHAAVARGVRQRHRVQGLRQRADLVDLHQQRVRGAPGDAVLEPLRVGDEQVVAHDLHLATRSRRSARPSRPSRPRPAGPRSTPAGSRRPARRRRRSARPPRACSPS